MLLRTLLFALISSLAVVSTFAADGDLDTTYNNPTGYRAVSFGASDNVFGGVLQPEDGKLLVIGGGRPSTNQEMSVARFNADGTLDTTFGGGTGKFSIDINVATTTDRATGGGLQSDGKIILGGYTRAGSSNDNFCIIRLNTNGTLDTTFGTSGITQVDFNSGNDRANDLVVLSDDSIIIAGWASDSFQSVDYDYALAKLTPAGALDTSFDTDGRATLDVGEQQDSGNRIAVQADGKIVIVGQSLLTSGTAVAVVARFNANGSLDTGFAGDGTFNVPSTTNPSLYSYSAVAVQADGKIMVGGYGYPSGIASSNADTLLMRLTSAGALDTTFNTTGYQTLNLSANYETFLSVIPQADGKYMAGGQVQNGSFIETLLVRYTSTGALDTGFNTTGYKKILLGSGSNRVASIHQISGGKVLVALEGGAANNEDFIAARFENTIVAPSGPEVNLQGNSTTIADGDTTPSTTDHTDFGSQSVVSGTIVRTFTIQNTGTANLTLTSLVISGTHAADYAVTAAPSPTVAAGGSTTFQVTFDPSALGARNATLTLASNDADEASYDFAIVGTGVDPEINIQGNSITIADGDANPSATDNTDFGSESVSSGTIVRTFTIQNTGTASLTISSVAVTGAASADYTVTSPPSSTVSAASSTTFQVTFDPSAVGARNATITVNSNDADEAAYDFAITGTGLGPQFDHFAVSAPGTAVAGTPHGVTVTAQDSSNNTVTTYTGTVAFTSDAPGVTLPANATFSAGNNGVLTLTGGISHSTAGLRTLTVTDTGNPAFTGTSGSIAVSATVAGASRTATFLDTTRADFEAGTAVSVTTASAPGSVVLSAAGPNQSNETVGTSGVGITVTTWGGQSFTPTVSGSLTKVDINLFASGVTGTTPALTLSVRATSAGLPTGADLATATVAGFNSGSSAFYSAVFATPATLTAGTQYALLIRPTANPSPGTYALTRSGTAVAGADVYASGTRLAGSSSGTTWSIPLTGGTSTDAGFRAYIGNADSTGSLNSAVKDSNPGVYVPVWTTLAWDASVPAGGALRFQVAGSASAAGPFDFVGPDGTAASYFTTSGASLLQFSGSRYLKYRADFTGAASGQVSLNDVTLVATVQTSVTLTTTAQTAATATVLISGSGFDLTPGNNTVAFNNGATGSVTAATESQLTVTLATAPNALGALTAVVTSGGISSGAPVQVATIIPGAADHLAYEVQPTVTTAGAAITPAVKVGILDASGLLTTSTAQVTLALSANPGSATLGGTTTVAAVAGVATFSGLSITKAADGYTLAATSGSLTGTTSDSFNVTPGAATHFVVTAPASADVGTAFTFTVTAQDVYENTATGYAGSALFVSTDALATLPAPATLTSGTGSFSATLGTQGSHTLTATDSVTSTITGTSGTISTLEVVSLAAADADATVAGDTGTYRFSRAGTGAALVVNFTLNAASTVVTADYALSGGGVVFNGSSGTVSIPAGSTSVDVTLTASANPTGAARPSKTVQLDLASGTGYGVSSSATGTVTIAQNGFGVVNANDSGAGSLRQAVANANALASDDVITFATPQNVVLTSGELAVAANGTLTLQGNGATSISGNNASRVFQVVSNASLTLKRVTIKNGVVTRQNGGGIHNAGTLTVLESTFSACSATEDDMSGSGGAIYNEGTLNVVASTFAANTSQTFGGAIQNDNGSMTLVNSTFSGNTSMDSGGAVGANFGTVLISSSTFTANQSGFGGGLFLANGTHTVTNCIVAGNTATGVGHDIYAFADSSATSFNNLVGTPLHTGFVVNGTNGNQVGTAGSPIDAKLGALADNGGPTLTHALLDGSPAVNAGDTSLLPLDTYDIDGNSNTAETLPVDQRGATFPRVIGSIVDIGAYEAFAFRPAITASTTNEDTQSTTGLVITPNTADGGLTTAFKITNIVGGTLFKADGTTAITAGTFLTLPEGAAGLKFTPSLNLNSPATTFGFDAQATVDGTDTGLRTGLATAVVTVTPVNDAPTVVAPGIADQTLLVTETRSVALPPAFADIDFDTLTFSVQSNSNSSRATATINGTNVDLLGVAPGITDITILANDGNTGTVTDTFRILVGTPNPTPGTVPPAGPGGYKVTPQTGLFGLTVPVTNTTSAPINGFRLSVDFSAYLAAYPSLRLYNSSSSPGVSPAYIDFPYPVAVNEVVNVELSFYTSTRTFPNPFAPVLTVTTLGASDAAGPAGPGVEATIRVTNPGRVVLEWASTPGLWYRVQYTNNLADPNSWYYSPIPLQASSTRTQWIDTGAPFTSSPPAGARFYRVNQIPAPAAP